jgi:imidazolonepropionase-like amidohydrolase
MIFCRPRDAFTPGITEGGNPMVSRLLAILLLAASSAFSQTTVIRAGHVIDPATGEAAANQVILVRDGKIVAFGAKIEVPKDATMVDLSRSWVLPGLIDAHHHLTLDIAPADAPNDLSALYLREGSGLRALRGMWHARQVLEAGFTMLRDLGNSANYVDADIRVAIERGWFPGPTIINSGKIITPFGGQSHGIPPEQPRPWLWEYRDADGPDEVRKAVRENIFYGAKIIKLAIDNAPYVYSEEEIRAAVTEAHRAGLAVAAHVFGGPGADNAIRAGVDSIEHGYELTDDQMQQMKDKGIFLVVTDAPRVHLEAIGTAGGIFPPPEANERHMLDRLKRANRIGVKIAFGTDASAVLPGEDRGQMLMDYLAVLTAGGVPAARILQYMTTNAAQLLRVAEERGALAVGKYADIVATPDNPLDDIQALRKINFVMKEGAIIKRPQ